MPFVFDAAPQRVYWELTRACDLACRHCRADAHTLRDARELKTPDVFRILEELAAGSKPHVVLTGGDPLKRRDFFEIVDYTVARGLPCSVSPSVTPLLTSAALETLASLRIAGMSLSLDGSTPPRHDSLRGVAGTFARTVQLAREIVDTSIDLQINTLVTSETVDDLPEIHRIVRAIGAQRWSLFFLVTTGRGTALHEITPGRAERVLGWAADRATERHPVVTATEAPHYRRIVLQRRAADRPAASRGFGIRDGNGVMFISHTGQVQPSGFLPIAAGSARTENPLQIYRESRLFQDLRRTDRFTGRCGCCEFREVCGGSRARAYAATGDPLASDPLCGYIPTAAIDRRAMMRD